MRNYIGLYKKCDTRFAKIFLDEGDYYVILLATIGYSSL